MREPIPSIGLFSHLLNEISYAVQAEPKRTSNFPIQHNTDGMEDYIYMCVWRCLLFRSCGSGSGPKRFHIQINTCLFYLKHLI